MKAILLLHGFKRNGEDDFGQIHDFFLTLGADKIFNEEWFDNYDKSTLNIKHFKKRANEITQKLIDEKVTDLIIVAYSSGSFIASIINERLNDINVEMYLVAPPIKIDRMKWIGVGVSGYKSQRKLIKKMGKERFKRLKSMAIENKTREKYPITIMIHIDKLRMKYASKILKVEHSKYLLSLDDEHINTKAVIKKLNKRHRELTITKFSHEEILKSQKDIAIKWLEESMK